MAHVDQVGVHAARVDRVRAGEALSLAGLVLAHLVRHVRACVVVPDFVACMVEAHFCHWEVWHGVVVVGHSLIALISEQREHVVGKALVSTSWGPVGVELDGSVWKQPLEVEGGEGRKGASQRVTRNKEFGRGILLLQAGYRRDNLAFNTEIGAVEPFVDEGVWGGRVCLSEEVDVCDPVGDVYGATEADHDLIGDRVVSHESKGASRIIGNRDELSNAGLS